MAKQNLASMSVDALLKLKDDIGAALSKKADALKKELVSLGSDYAEVGRIAIYGKKSKLKGRSNTGTSSETIGLGEEQRQDGWLPR